MCIFSQPVLSVNNTQIFARRTADDSQFVVYQMNYESAHQNAMILPVPVRRPARQGSLRFIDLSHYETFFDDLATGFPYRFSSGFGCAAGSAVDSKPALEVFKAGNYIASFVPALSDFARLDKRFSLPDATWSKLPQYQHYGFAVFQLAEGSLRPHPMAFDFESASSGIYFPTLHIHDGEIHPTEEFDHVLYLQHAGFDSRVSAYDNCDSPDRTTNLIRSEQVAQEFCKIDDTRGIVVGNLLVHRKIIRGGNSNQDTEILTSGHPTIPAFNWRAWTLPSTCIAFLGAVSWLLMRRHHIKRMKRSEQLAASVQPQDETPKRGIDAPVVPRRSLATREPN